MTSIDDLAQRVVGEVEALAAVCNGLRGRVKTLIEQRDEARAQVKELKQALKDQAEQND